MSGTKGIGIACLTLVARTNPHDVAANFVCNVTGAATKTTPQKGYPVEVGEVAAQEDDKDLQRFHLLLELVVWIAVVHRRQIAATCGTDSVPATEKQVVAEVARSTASSVCGISWEWEENETGDTCAGLQLKLAHEKRNSYSELLFSSVRPPA